MDYWHCNNASDTRNVLCEISKLDSVRFNYLFANIQLRFRNLYEFLLTDFFFRRRCRRAYCWTQQSRWAPHFQIANSFICRYLDWWCDVTWCQNHIKKFSRIGLIYLQVVLLEWLYRSKFNCFFPFSFLIFSSNFLCAWFFLAIIHHIQKFILVSIKIRSSVWFESNHLTDFSCETKFFSHECHRKSSSSVCRYARFNSVNHTNPIEVQTVHCYRVGFWFCVDYDTQHRFKWIAAFHAAVYSQIKWIATLLNSMHCSTRMKSSDCWTNSSVAIDSNLIISTIPTRW